MITDAGVYTITCTRTGRAYVGSTTALRKRRQQHFANLRKGIHHAKELQDDYNRYGPDYFVFTILNRLIDDERRMYDGLRAAGIKTYNEVRPNSRPPRPPKLPTPIPPGYPRYYVDCVLLRGRQGQSLRIPAVVTVETPKEKKLHKIRSTLYFNTFKAAQRALERSGDEPSVVNFREAAKLVSMSEDGLRYYLNGAGKPALPDHVLRLDDRLYYDRKQVIRWNEKRNSAKSKSSRLKSSGK